MVTREQGFEERLLEELQLVVAERRPARKRRRHAAVTIGAAAAVAVAAGAVTLVQLNRPAYAVERDVDGSVRVSIFDYRDPDGLRQRLAAFGVRADVNFLPYDRTCREPRADYVPPDEMPLALVDWPAPGSNESFFRLHPQYIGAGQTLVYTVRVDRRAHDQRAVIRLANGPVAACERIAV
ncbi:hypothetical protein [Dactylosporangium sp. CA-233914]|uniref:hypothetical protein n=1 Tax=Dactylosporangium sp. CA-233914 TaxID=3239934 RepID=UPI003D8D5C60